MKVAIIFPGQGSQSVGMLDVWKEHPASAAVVEQANDALGSDLAALCHDEAALARTDITQQAVLTADVAAFRVLQAEGITPVAVAGHSLGEYAALVAAGVCEFGPAFNAVKERSLAMADAGDANPGTMLALVGMSADDAAQVCEDARGDSILVVANENSQMQTVLAGAVDAIERAEELAKERKARPIRPNVAGAFHSPLMEPARARIDAAIDGLAPKAASIPVVQNVTAAPTTDPDTLIANLRVHVISPVHWVATMDQISGLGAQMVIEAGPGDVLSRMGKRDHKELTFASARNPEEAIETARAALA